MSNKIIAIALLAILLMIGFSGCTSNPPSSGNNGSDALGDNQDGAQKSCSAPSDCGKFYDCVNSKCVEITPPALPA